MPGKPVALGFDIGGSITKIALVNQRGEVSAVQKFPTDLKTGSPDAFIAKLISKIRSILENRSPQVIGIGGSFLGWINNDRTGPIYTLNAPTLHGLNLKKLIENEFELPVILHDDVTAHTLAEFAYGSGRGVRRFMCLAMGTGLGAGVIIDGQPLQFTGGCSGDTGHIILRPGGPSCTSGCKGCGEALIGITGIERLGRQVYKTHTPAHEIIRKAALKSDPLAIRVMSEIGLYTGELLASLSAIFLPSRIALTGGTARAGEVLVKAARDRFEDIAGEYHRTFSRLSNGEHPGVEIVTGELQGETGAIGAVVDFFQPVHPPFVNQPGS
jgi:glucokinase